MIVLTLPNLKTSKAAKHLHLTVIFSLRFIYVYCTYKIEILHNGVQLGGHSCQFCNPWWLIDSLKLAIVSVFTPWKYANAIVRCLDIWRCYHPVANLQVYSRSLQAQNLGAKLGVGKYMEILRCHKNYNNNHIVVLNLLHKLFSKIFR